MPNKGKGNPKHRPILVDPESPREYTVEDAPIGFKNDRPHSRGNDLGNGPRQENHGAQKASPGEILVQYKGDSERQNERENDRDAGKIETEQRAVDSLFAGQNLAPLVKSHIFGRTQNDIGFMQAQPERIAQRNDNDDEMKDDYA